MRGYLTTAVAVADAIFRDGFTDLHWFGDGTGVLIADRQLDINEGFEGSLTLCLDVPEDEYGRHEIVEEGAESDYRLSLIPAAVLNSLARPRVYDHAIAGCSRRELLQVIRRQEQAGQPGGFPCVQDIRDAIVFFDRIGWLTPVKVREAEQG